MWFEICYLERFVMGERDDWPMGMKEEKTNGAREREWSDSKKRRK